MREDAKQMALSGLAARLSEEDFNMLLHAIDTDILTNPQGDHAQHLRIIREVLLLYVHALHFSLNFMDQLEKEPPPLALSA